MTLYVWEVLDAKGTWGTIAATVTVPMPEPEPKLLALVHHDRTIIENLAGAALAHHEATGLPIRLVRYEEAEVLTTHAREGDRPG